MKKAGVVLDEVHRYPNKKKGVWRRGSNASAISGVRAANNSHQPTPELGENDSSNNTEHERTVSPSPAVSAAIIDEAEASRSSAGGESDKVEDKMNTESNSPVLSLFSKSPYEGFYDLRAMVR